MSRPKSATRTITTRSLFLVGALMATSLAVAGPLAHRYTFNDGTANDSIGKAHGEVVGDVKIAQGQAQFTGGPNQRIELLSNGDRGININTLKAVTIEAWYTPGTSQAPWQRIFDFGASTGLGVRGSTGSNYLFYTPIARSNESRAAMSATGIASEALANGPLPTKGTEIHIVVVVDDKNIAYYLNGALLSESDLAGRSLASLSTDHALLGQALFGNDAILSGSINEFRIYKCALTAPQVAASFNAGPDKVVRDMR